MREHSRWLPKILFLSAQVFSCRHFAFQPNRHFRLFCISRVSFLSLYVDVVDYRVVKWKFSWAFSFHEESIFLLTSPSNFIISLSIKSRKALLNLLIIFLFHFVHMLAFDHFIKLAFFFLLFILLNDWCLQIFSLYTACMAACQLLLWSPLSFPTSWLRVLRVCMNFS